MGNKTNKEEVTLKSLLQGRSHGQILVMVAAAMVGLLVAAGLAVDGGFLMLRKAQFDRAVDAAALTGVTVVSATDNTSVDRANVRGRQILAANGVTIDTDDHCDMDGDTPILPDGVDYCGTWFNGMMPGAVRYHVVARWDVPTFFMPLIGFDTVPLVGTAVAEYFPLVDMYASDVNEQGMVQASMLSAFGPNACTISGDAYSPPHTGGSGAEPSWYKELNGIYTYRIAIPPEDDFPFDKVRVEIFDPDTYNVYVTNGTYYLRNGGMTTANCRTDLSAQRRSNACLLNTSDPVNPNWFLKVDEARGVLSGSSLIVDCGNIWQSNYGSDSYYPSVVTTHTLFRLFYYEQSSAGTLREVDLAYYMGKKDGDAEAPLTDIKWIAPGARADELSPGTAAVTSPPADVEERMPATAAEPAVNVESCAARTTMALNPYLGASGPMGAGECAPSVADETGQAHNFIIDLNSEVPGMYIDPNSGLRHIYLQVITQDGASENSFALWAGPGYTAEPAADFEGPMPAPADVNARQLQIVRALESATPEKLHSSHGIVIYGMGHMTTNWTTSVRTRFPLAYLGTEYSGQTLHIELFDNKEAEPGEIGSSTSGDGGASPFYFYFDTIPTENWTACYAHSLSDCTNAKDDDTNPRYPDSPDWTRISCFLPSTGSNSLSDCLGKGVTGVHPDMDNIWARYTFVVPTELNEVSAQRVPFYGGRLYVSYRGGIAESSTWKMTVDARPTLYK
ncbi:MAG: Tad domain-containing protein [Anaerolineae bacterium]|nr:Tad domain-containing protein [Anaerolineae bacterium]